MLNTLDSKYKNLVQNVLQNGDEKTDRTGTGTISLFGQELTHDMREGFPLLTSKKMSYKSIFAELLWFMRGQTNIKHLHDDNCHIWDGDWNKNLSEDIKSLPKEDLYNDFGCLGKIYGYQWRGLKIDQLKTVIENIRKDPLSRRHIVNSWNVNDLNDMVLPPCHYSYQFVSNGKELSVLVSQRSADLLLGVPFNIASYGALLTLVAKMTNHIPRFVKLSFGDCHIYKNHVDGALRQINQKEYDLPELELPKNIDYRNIDLDHLLLLLDVDKFKIKNYNHSSRIYFPLSN